jgi:subtilisin-like proprotein convertase family protein
MKLSGLILLLLVASFVSKAQVLLTESFESATFPPTGWSIYNNGTGNDWTHNTTNAGFVSQGTSSMTYYYVSTDAADAWAFSPGIQLNAGDSVLVSFDYVVASANWPERFRVTVGNGQNVAAQNTVVWVDSMLMNQSFMTGHAGVRIAANGTYNFGFNCFSLADEYVLGIDNIRIERIFPVDMKMHPYAGTTFGCSFSSGEEISIDVENLGANVQTGFPVAYQINNGPVVSETIPDPVAPGDVYTYIFNTGADFSVPGTYYVKFFTQLPGDADHTDDTTFATITSGAFGQMARSSIDTAFIPDNNPVGVKTFIPFCGLQSPLGSQIRIKRLTIVGITHTYCDDLALYLYSPLGDSILLAQHIGGSSDNYPTITFTDTASVNILVFDNTAITSGYYHTQDSTGFARFNGQDPNGNWNLFARDDAAVDIGYVVRWTLEFANIVGVREFTSVSDLVTVYPNPNAGVFTISPSSSRPLQAEIMSVNGQLLKTVQLNGVPESIDLRAYAKGMYFVKAIGDNTVQTLKVIVD